MVANGLGARLYTRRNNKNHTVPYGSHEVRDGCAPVTVTKLWTHNQVAHTSFLTDRRGMLKARRPENGSDIVTTLQQFAEFYKT